MFHRRWIHFTAILCFGLVAAGIGLSIRPATTAVVHATGSNDNSVPAASHEVSPSPALPAKAFVSIISPTTGMTLTSGTDVGVDWVISGTYGGAYLDYTFDGSTWYPVYYPNASFPNCVPAGVMSDGWTVPGVANPRNAQLRLQAMDQCKTPNVVVGSDQTGDILILPVKLQWIFPNGGETLLSTKPYDLQWAGQNADSAKYVYVFTSTNGVDYYPLPTANRIDYTEQLDNWQPPPYDTDTLTLRVTACAYAEFCQRELAETTTGNIRVRTDPNFQSIMLTFPDGLLNGEPVSFFKAETQPIRWTTTGNIPDAIYIYYSLDGGASFPPAQQIADCAPNTGQYLWTVPTVEFSPQTQVRIRIVARSSCGGSDIASDVSSSDHIISNISYNRRPFANTGRGQTVTETDPVVLDASASWDMDGDALRYQWRQTGGPAVTLVNSNSVTAQFIAPSVETTSTLSFRLIVDDGPGRSPALSSVARATVRVRPLPPTVIALGPCGTPGTAVTFYGLNLAGSSVRFNGLGAVTIVNGDTQLVAFVPSGATSGPVSLVHPAGTFVLPGTFVVPTVSLGARVLTQGIEGEQLIWRKDTLLQVFPSRGGVFSTCSVTFDGGTVRVRQTNGVSTTVGGWVVPGPTLNVPYLFTPERLLNESVNFLIPAAGLNFPKGDFALDVVLSRGGYPVLTSPIPVTSAQFFEPVSDPQHANLRILTVFVLPRSNTTQQIPFSMMNTWQDAYDRFLHAYPLPNADPGAVFCGWTVLNWDSPRVNGSIDLTDCNKDCDKNDLGSLLNNMRGYASANYYCRNSLPTHVQAIIDPSLKAPNSPPATSWRPGSNGPCQVVLNSCWDRVSLVFAIPGILGINMSHEIGHNLGLVSDGRPNCCANDGHSRYNEGGTSCVPAATFTASEIDQNMLDAYNRARPLMGIGLTGRTSVRQFWSQLSQACVANPMPKSIMSYAPYQDDTNAFFEAADYQYIFDQVRRPIPFLSRPQAPSDQPVFWMQGSVDGVGQVSIFDSRLYATLAPNPPVTATSPYSVAFMSGSQQLALYPLGVNFGGSHDEVHDTGLFSGHWTFPDATDHINLLHDAGRLYTITVSAHPPTLTLNSPTGGANFGAAQPVTVAWTASDPDGDALRYYVSYSADGGTTFQPLAVDITQTQFVWHTNLAAATSQGLIRVEASDGVHVTAASSGLFSVAAHAPAVAIVTPNSGAVFHAGEEVALHASAFSPDEGFLDGMQLQWQSSLDGPLGEGSLLHTRDLTAGTHIISLTATGGGGLSSTQQISLTIVPAGQWADMVIAASGTPRARPGGAVTYQLSYSNSGTLAAMDASLTAALAPGLDYTGVSSADPLLGNPLVTLDGHTGSVILRWPLGAVAPGGHGAVTIFALVKNNAVGGAPHSSVFSARHLSPEANEADNSALVYTNIDALIFLPSIRR